LIICEETSYKGLFELLSLTTTDQTLTALLIGKYNHARELGATLEIDAPDGKTEIPEYLDRHTLVTIVGNLLDNACEAVQVKPREQRKVRLSLTRGPELLKIQVHDSGNGVDPALGDAIFTKGVSGKDGNGRGIGLYLVTRAVDSLCGSVSYTQSVMGGACFTVSLPLNMREDDEYRQSIDR
jgi:sensor histidine kinase regulating citrate/malate metabolism